MQGYVITILITNYNTIDFTKHSLQALEKLTVNKYKVLINDNGSSSREVDALKELSSENVTVFFNQNNKTASYAHAEALDFLIEKVETKYTVILDSDCVFLMHGWDVCMISMMTDNIKIVGSPLPRGRSGKKPYDFPFQYAVMFDTNVYKKLEITCLPRDLSKGEDTCWEWKSAFLGNGYSSYIFKVISTRDDDSTLLSNIVCNVYYLCNHIIASHWGRGSSLGYAKYYQWIKVPFVFNWLKKLHGVYDKRRWIKRTGQLIDREYNDSIYE